MAEPSRSTRTSPLPGAGRLAEHLRSPAGRRNASIAALLALLVLCFTNVRRTEDFDGYVLVGELVLQGGHVYDDAPPGISTWPPLFGILAVPLALLARISIHLARGLWLAGQLVALLWVLRLIADLLYDRVLAIWPRRDTTDLVLASPPILVPLVLCYGGITGNFIHLQINILIFALVLQGLAWQGRGRAPAGGALLGLATAVRVMPLVFIPYLIVRGRWKAAVATVLACVLLTLSPALVYGWETFADYFASWLRVTGQGWGSGFMNQSFLAMFDRYLGHGVVPFATEEASYLPEAAGSAARIATWILLGILGIVALWRFRGPCAPAGHVAVTEWSIVFLVGAYGGPVCWKSYLVVLLLPLALLYAVRHVWEVKASTRWLAAWLLVAAFVLLTLPTRDLIGRWLAVQLEMGSVYTLGGLVLLGGLFWLHRDLQRLETPLA